MHHSNMDTTFSLYNKCINPVLDTWIPNFIKIGPAVRSLTSDKNTNQLFLL